MTSGYIPFSVQVTPEKLEELKTKIPRAGPKYRLGMYFETIHDLSEFEEVCGPEDGYSSCWETETEFDSELGNFIFHNVTGDSASVICIDEAMDLLTMREQQQQMKQQLEEARRKGLSDNIGGDLNKLGPGELEEYTFDQQSDGKRSEGASRHSHHSGSDGTYDGLQQQTPLHATHLVTTPPESPEHIYETLDACQDHHFQVYVAKEPADMQHPAAKAPGNASDNDSDKTFTVRKSSATKSSSFRSAFGKGRMSQSFDQPTALPKKEKLKKKMSLDSQERAVQVAPKHSQAPPIKGYGVEKQKRLSQEKMSSSPSSTNSSPNLIPPSLVIKHKGKTYFIPVIEKKKDGKNKQASSSSKRVHNVLCTSVPNHHPLPSLPSHLPSLPTNACAPFANGPSAAASGTSKRLNNQGTDHFDGTSRRRKSQQQCNNIAPPTKHSNASNKVTHYGML